MADTASFSGALKTQYIDGKRRKRASRVRAAKLAAAPSTGLLAELRPRRAKKRG